MKSNNNFDINNFISPDASCAPVYIWVWNDICTREIIDTQLAEMQNLGIRAFYILPEPKDFRPDSMPTSLEPDYLSDEYFELCAYTFKKAKDLGMNCWIYDEGGWPSGGACGKVMKDRPEFAVQTLEVYDRSFSAGETYKRTRENVIAAFIDEVNMISEGYVFDEDTVAAEYVIEKGSGNYPDLLNKKATEYFIEITHQKYPLCSNVTAVFTDEPKAPTDAFSNELADKYNAIYDESILPHLPLIMGRAEVTEENVHILRRWYDICSRAFCDSFLLPCKKWANENGIAFTGHLDKDHEPLGCINGGNNFNLMRALRCLDIPGIDVIWRQLYPENRIAKKDDMNGYNGFFPRYASSAASQNGTKLTMCEILGVAGAAVTYDVMRYTVGYLAVRGINIFNIFNFPLGRKNQLLAQELPIFTQNQPYYKHLNIFNRYMERLSYVSSLGERVCETALYYPVSDFVGGMNADAVAKAFDSLGRTLEEMTVDFDIVDDDALQAGKISDEGFVNIGTAKYKHIIIPEGAFIPDAARKALSGFIEQGGRVSYELANLKPVINVEGKGLRAMHRKAENAEIFCLFRESGEDGDYRIRLPASNGYLLDLTNGRLQTLNTCESILNLSLTIGETAVILLTDEILDAEDKNKFNDEFEINEFMFRKETELICSENGFENTEHTDNTAPINLGDWSYLIGNAYSGSCVYETSFTFPDEKIGKEGEIDLGEVHFSASVYLNGRSLGTALTAPYRLRIPEGVLAKENNLKIVVTNTSANWYTHTDYFDRWSIKELSPYFETELNYAKDCVSGGLYGPVVIYTQ